MTIHQRVAQLRDRAQLTVAEAAALAGYKSPAGWHHYERPDSFTSDFLTLKQAQKLAKALVGKGDPPIQAAEVLALADVANVDSVLHVPLSGEVEIALVAEAGAWRESIDYATDDRVKLPISSDLGIDSRYLFGVEVRGNSMDLVYPHGSKVICASLDAVEVQNGDDVLARRNRGGLYETTLKRLHVSKTGKRLLLPQSTRPEHQEPISLDEPGVDEVEIVGVVVAEFRIRPRPRLKTTHSYARTKKYDTGVAPYELAV